MTAARALIAALAALAAFAAGCTAGLGGASEDAGRGPFVVDESEPRYRNVGLGSTTREVERLLGRAGTARGFAPVGRSPVEVAVPQTLPNPEGAGRGRPALRRYEDSAFLLLRGEVYAMMLTGPRVQTSRGVAIGDAMDEVRRRYDEVECREVATGESRAGEAITYPSCQVRVAPAQFVFFGGHPIRSITFYSSARLDG
jgi:hypothetical protein